jgi:hypothetical protein
MGSRVGRLPENSPAHRVRSLAEEGSELVWRQARWRLLYFPFHAPRIVRIPLAEMTTIDIVDRWPMRWIVIETHSTRYEMAISRSYLSMLCGNSSESDEWYRRLRAAGVQPRAT